LTDIQALLIKEKYPTGVSQRQRVLELEEMVYQDNLDGYNYFDNGDFQSESDSGTSTTSIKKIGKRLVLHETEE
jgi:carnitine O-acetyltransferase